MVEGDIAVMGPNCFTDVPFPVFVNVAAKKSLSGSVRVAAGSGATRTLL